MNKQERTPLAPEIVDAARKSLLIGHQEATDIINKIDPLFLQILSSLLEESKTDSKVRSALNRVTYVTRNATFAQACKAELQRVEDEK